MTSDAEHLATGVAAWGLDGDRDHWPADPLPPAVWDHVLSLVDEQRLIGLLAAGIRAGDLPADAGQQAEVESGLRAAMAGALALERKALDVVAHLDAEGIDHRILKGAAVAHLDYPDPALRVFGDVDVLVRAEQFDDAIATLVATGGERRYPEPRPGFDRRFSKGSCVVDADGIEVDVHRTFAMGPFGVTMVLDDLWASGQGYELGGRPLVALQAEHRLLHACYHAVLGSWPPRLLTLRDIAQLLRRPGMDLELVRTTAERWQGDAVLAVAVESAAATIGADVPQPLDEWMRSFRPSARQARGLDAHLSPDKGRSYPWKSWEAFLAMHGVRDRAAFARALAIPDRSYIRPRYSSNLDRWRAALHSLLDRGRR